MKYLWWTLWCLVLFFSCSEPENDSTLIDFEKASESIINLAFDSNKVALKKADKYLRIAQRHSMEASIWMLNTKAVVYSIANNSGSALELISEAEVLCEGIPNKNKLLGKTLNNKAIVHKNNGQLSLALQAAKKSYQYRKPLGNSIDLSRSASTIGTIYERINLLDSAIVYTHKALAINLALDSNLEAGNSYMTKGNVECELRHWTEALASFTNALGKYKKIRNSKKKIADVHFSLGNAYKSLHKLDSAAAFYQMALSGYRDIGSQQRQAMCMDGIGNTFLHRGNIVNAEQWLLSSYSLADSLKDAKGIFTGALHLSQLYLKKNDFAKGLLYLSKAEKANQGGHQLDDVYSAKRDAFKKIGQSDSALVYADKYLTIRESIADEKLIRQKQELDVQYLVERHKRERDQAHLREKTEHEKNEQLTVMIVVLGFLLLSLAVITLLIRQALKAKTKLAKTNEELHQTELENLKKQATLDKMSLLMEGQEQERSRISKELHDNFGATLSTIKIHLGLVGKDVKKNTKKLSKIQGLIDDAHIDIRRISHDMASNVLGKFGLVAAIRDLADHFNSSGHFGVLLTLTEEAKITDKTTEIHLYRIVQEALNNIAKHAMAPQATINLSIWPESVVLIVEDNGKGFSKEEVKSKKSMGLENMQARVDLMNGQLNVDSTMGSGTTLTIEVPLKNESHGIENG